MAELVIASLPSAAGGFVLGLLYFWGLWWTVRQLTTARFPGLLVFVSFLLRTAVAATGIVVISGGRPIPLGVAVAAFLVARIVMVRTIGRPGRGGGATDPSGTA